ncbi:hypothetical protein [Acinetobacter sp. ANC 4640]
MSALSFLNGFAQGMDPSATRLILGDFEFLDFEVPERIQILGKQKTVIHQMIGGKRVIDVLGTEYDPIRWSGIITGSESSSRVQALEQIRDAGNVVTLTLDDISFDVVVIEFAPTYEFKYRRPYHIEVAVLKRNDAPSSVNSLLGSLDALINSDIGEMLGLANIINMDDVTNAITEIQTTVATVKDIAHATIDTVQTIIRPIIAAQQLVHGAITSLESTARSITTLGGLIPGNPISKTVNNLLSQVDSVVRLPALYQLSNVLYRLDKNVRSGQTADGVKTVTQSGGNLMTLASQVYGDQSLWTSIGTANNITDPQITGIQTLVIPSNPSN